MYKRFLVILTVVIMLFSSISYAGEVYDKLYDSPQKVEDGVRFISYDQLMELRNSGEKYKLFDVLQEASYNKGHIPGAESLPVFMINKDNAAKQLSKNDNLIVYCGRFKCHASTNAAKALQNLGYKVVDYKGGLKEWKEKGNKLVR